MKQGTSSFMTSALDALVFVQVCVYVVNVVRPTTFAMPNFIDFLGKLLP